MTDRLTDEQLDAIEARANAATEGPWCWQPYGARGKTLAHPIPHFHEANVLKTTDDWAPHTQDAEFIAHAREDVPALLAEVRRLSAKVARLDSDTYPRTTEGDS